MPQRSKQANFFVSVVMPVQDQSVVTKKAVVESAQILKKHYTNYEVVVVDNGSGDDTIESLQPVLKEQACIRVIRLSRRHDRETAIFAGIEAAIGDYVTVLLPATDDPKLIPDLVSEAELGVDIVYGVSKSSLPYSWISRFGRSIFNWYNRRFIKVNIPDRATYLMSLNRRAVNALTRTQGRYRHIRHVSSLVGFKVGTLPYELKDDSAHKIPRGIREEIDLAWEITVSYSSHPLRFVSRLGLLAGLLNVLYGAYVLIVYVFERNVAQGWTTLSLQTSVMFFLVFTILSVLSDYVGRIMEESRDQPSYHIMEELTSNVLIADETRRNITQE